MYSGTLLDNNTPLRRQPIIEPAHPVHLRFHLDSNDSGTFTTQICVYTATLAWRYEHRGVEPVTSRGLSLDSDNGYHKSWRAIVSRHPLHQGRQLLGILT